MLKKNSVPCTLALISLCMLFTGCGNTGNTATPDTAATATSAPTSTPLPTPTSTPTPMPTDEWTYHIEQDGFYNAVAEWDEDGNLLSYPTEFNSGDYIYYNDCDEYYNNFVHEKNVFNDAQLTTDFDVRHSGDNSVKITSRESYTNGFSGFALRFTGDNVLSVSDFNNSTCTLGFWLYFEDNYFNGIPEEFTFAIWSNLDEGLNPEDANFVPKPEKDAPEEEKELYNLVKAANDLATEDGFSFLTSVTIPIDTWCYVEVPFNISITDLEALKNPALVIGTLGESNVASITYYNPFYLDDITVTFESEITQDEESDDSEEAEPAEAPDEE